MGMLTQVSSGLFSLGAPNVDPHVCAKQWVTPQWDSLGLKEPPVGPHGLSSVTQAGCRAQLPQSHVWAPVSHCLQGFE